MLYLWHEDRSAKCQKVMKNKACDIVMAWNDHRSRSAEPVETAVDEAAGGGRSQTVFMILALTDY